ncbi:MAG: hypothetical protein N2651_04270 [Fimbriimonadales bacterium]|nr:hypothetical protein [Fimbriimonadales bacterium]
MANGDHLEFQLVAIVPSKDPQRKGVDLWSGEDWLFLAADAYWRQAEVWRK